MLEGYRNEGLDSSMFINIHTSPLSPLCSRVQRAVIDRKIEDEERKKEEEVREAAVYFVT